MRRGTLLMACFLPSDFRLDLSVDSPFLGFPSLLERSFLESPLRALSWDARRETCHVRTYVRKVFPLLGVLGRSHSWRSKGGILGNP